MLLPSVSWDRMVKSTQCPLKEGNSMVGSVFMRVMEALNTGMIITTEKKGLHQGATADKFYQIRANRVESITGKKNFRVGEFIDLFTDKVFRVVSQEEVDFLDKHNREWEEKQKAITGELEYIDRKIQELLKRRAELVRKK